MYSPQSASSHLAYGVGVPHGRSATMTPRTVLAPCSAVRAEVISQQQNLRAPRSQSVAALKSVAASQAVRQLLLSVATNLHSSATAPGQSPQSPRNIKCHNNVQIP